MRFAQLAAVFLIPVGAVVLALTFRSSTPGPPLTVVSQARSYTAAVGTPLTVTGFRVANHTKTAVTIERIRVATAPSGMKVIGALAYRGCASCVTSSSVPPTVTPPTDVAAPKLLPVTTFLLKPGEAITLLLSVQLTKNGTVRVPPLRIDTTSPAGSRTLETLPGPVLCAGKGC